MKGWVFDIQRYGLYDGPGIRTLVFFKGCPLRCAWCHNPESQAPGPELSWLEQNCSGCGRCAPACPTGALEPVGGDRPRRNQALCRLCGECARACPNDALALIGCQTTPREILETVLADKPFYETSGGGATITGGEPGMQPEFLIEVLTLIKAAGIHTAVETCGLFGPELVEPLCALADLVLFDIKHADPARHRELTGAGLETIHDNFRRILNRVPASRILPRIPVIPGANDDHESILGIVGFLAGAGYSGPAHLMPYNPLAASKWARLGRADEYRDYGQVSEPDLERIAAVFRQAGIEAAPNY